jgi:hypothetical protein
LPFEKPKLAVVASVREEDLVDRMERARAESARVINSRPTQVIEPPKPTQATQVEPEPMAKPFAVDNKSRFRRL